MTTYQLPPELDGPVWDEAESKWMRSKENNMWYGGNQDMYLSWGDVVHYFGPLTTTIAKEKDEKMTEYRMPKELEDGPLWNSRGDMWTRLDSDRWVHDESGIVSSWLALLVNHGPLTDTPTQPIKEGDTGLTAEQVWDLPKGTVIWPERAVNPEPWMRWGDTWESISEVAGDAGELQCACGASFTVLRLGGGE